MSNQLTLTSTDIWPSLPLDAWQETYTTPLIEVVSQKSVSGKVG